MDWADSPELMEIYLTEVDQRSGALVDGARALVDGSLDTRAAEDLVRDAHTLKGSSHMVGRSWVGDGAAVLERAWKEVVRTGASHLPVLGSAMFDLAAVLASAARSEEPVDRLHDLQAHLEATLARGQDDTAVLAGHADDELGAESLMTPDPRPHAVDVHLETAGVEAAPSEAAPTETTLGGLLPALEAGLAGSVMRVDSGGLYALINRIAEIAIELDSLDDLSVVRFDDSSRMPAAWKAQIERVVAEIADVQDAAVSLVTVPFLEGLETFPQFVRFLSRRLDREVRFETSGVGISVDRQIVELLREPLRHLVVNSVDHGIERPDDRLAAGKPRTGIVRLTARLDDDRLEISVSDDGRGIDWDAVRAVAERKKLRTSPSELRGHLLSRGFTTVVPEGEFSGTGEGLALLGDAVDRLNGSVLIESTPGRGTSVLIDVPASLVLQRIVTVSAEDQVVGVPEAAVIDVIEAAQVVTEGGHRHVEHDGEKVPYVDLSSVIGGRPSTGSPSLLLATRYGGVAVGVDQVIGQRRLAVKGLGPILEGSPHISGAAFLGGGQVLVVMDHNHLARTARRESRRSGSKPRILVVDDSAGVRQLIAATLRGNGFDVTLANDVDSAFDRLRDGWFDGLIVDYSMPGSNGTELVRRTREEGIGIPIIMVSGVADDAEQTEAYAVGVDLYLDKFDVRRGALAEALDRLMDDRRPVPGG